MEQLLLFLILPFWLWVNSGYPKVLGEKVVVKQNNSGDLACSITQACPCNGKCNYRTGQCVNTGCKGNSRCAEEEITGEYACVHLKKVDSSGDENLVGHKVLVCHLPPGNPENAQIISIDYHAWINGHSPHNLHKNDFVIDETHPDCPPLATPTLGPYPTWPEIAIPTIILPPEPTEPVDFELIIGPTNTLTPEPFFRFLSGQICYTEDKCWDYCQGSGRKLLDERQCSCYFPGSVKNLTEYDAGKILYPFLFTKTCAYCYDYDNCYQYCQSSKSQEDEKDCQQYFAKPRYQPPTPSEYSYWMVPHLASMSVGDSVQFRVIVWDKNGFTVRYENPEDVQWQVVNGGGIINDQGVFTAGDQLGTFTNTVRGIVKEDGRSYITQSTVKVVAEWQMKYRPIGVTPAVGED